MESVLECYIPHAQSGCTCSCLGLLHFIPSALDPFNQIRKLLPREIDSWHGLTEQGNYCVPRMAPHNWNDKFFRRSAREVSSKCCRVNDIQGCDSEHFFGIEFAF